MESDGNAFRWIWVAPSIILGLGLTRLLSDAVVVFRSRSRATLDWVPLAWAASIFVLQVQYLWAVIELPQMSVSWRLVDFLMLLGLSLFLFVAAAMVLPDQQLEEGESLTESFRSDGRWALLALSAWAAEAIFANRVLFDLPLLTYEAGLLAGLVVLPLLFLALPSRRVREVVTVANLALTLWAAWELSPKTY